MRTTSLVARIVLLAALALLAGCAPRDQAVPASSSGTSPAGEPAAATGTAFPDVVDATVSPTGPGTVSVSATISSPYDTPARYADAFRARTPEGQVLGVRDLVHDHADEQPFTRTLTGVAVPVGVDRIVVEGRDMVSGWGGATVTVELPR